MNENGKQIPLTWSILWGFVVIFLGAISTLFAMQSAKGEDIATLKQKTETQAETIAEIKTSLKSIDGKITELLIRAGTKQSSVSVPEVIKQ